MKIKVWGEYGLFTRPETKADPFSYPFLTPSAALGILKSIFWKPEIEYTINSITVLNPIRYASFFRNMGKSKIVPCNYDKEPYLINEDRSQRNFVVLKNPAYIIDFDVSLTEKANDPIDKYFAIINERIKRGACFKQPCMGVKEYAANFEFLDGTEQVHPELLGEFKFGLILKKMNFTVNKTGKISWFDHQQGKVVKGEVVPEYFEAIMRNGVVKC